MKVVYTEEAFKRSAHTNTEPLWAKLESVTASVNSVLVMAYNLHVPRMRYEEHGADYEERKKAVSCEVLSLQSHR
jgi:hypothetical protein